jgi:hypothetical protein
MKSPHVPFTGLPYAVFLAFFCILFFPVVTALAEAPLLAPKVGDVYKMTLVTERNHESSDSSGSSESRNILVKRVIDVRAEGLELVYDLPETSTQKERDRQWQFPVRVLEPLEGALQLLNVSELEARVADWLMKFKVPRTACGTTVFTWTAFRIECDPQSVRKTIGQFDMGISRLYEGAPFQDAAALGTGKLVKKTSGPEGAAFTAEIPIDPDAVRRAHAENDVTIGQMTNNPVTLEAAMARRERETVSGMISVVFEADNAGNIHRRTKVTKIDIARPDGETETYTMTEVLEQELLPSQPVGAEKSGE